MESSLEDRTSSNSYQLENDELKVAIPLMRCIEGLKAKHNAIAKVHRERFEQVKSMAYHECNLDMSDCFQNLSKLLNPILPILNHPS